MPAPKKAKEFAVSDFKARCLKLVDNLPANGIILTKRGKPIARVIPMKGESPFHTLYGSMKDSIEVIGDLVSTGEEWDAES